MRNLLFFIVFFQFYPKIGSAHDVHRIKQHKVENSDSLSQFEETRMEDRQTEDERESQDSLNLVIVLKNALNTVYQNLDETEYQKSYKDTLTDLEVNVTIEMDNQFSASAQHLTIHRRTPGFEYIDIYSKNDSIYIPILSHTEWNMTYINDTIMDINGDGLSDFVVNGYGSNGCCLKAYSNVYIFRDKQNKFTESYDLINPTFYPSEHIVRGVCYGHMGDTELYKYQWNGESLDTIEYVRYETDALGERTGRVIIAKNLPIENESDIIKIIDSVPKEYEDVLGYEWFTGE